ncbi:MAG: hypothetical protein E6X86_04585 [Clostridium butyricum]|nr:hypothetical protein [Clostridium butyricum]MDU4853567.1 hypothetical protein [Clostridioides difficile]
MAVKRISKLVYFNMYNEEDVEIIKYFKDKNFSKWVKRRAEQEIREKKRLIMEEF